MDMRSTLTNLFPAGRVVDCCAPNGDLLEVRELPQGTVPQNCEVLAGGTARLYWGRDRQAFYLVKTEDFLVLLRICPAGPDIADGDFVICRGYSPLGDKLVLDFQATVRKSIEILCSSQVSRWSS